MNERLKNKLIENMLEEAFEEYGSELAAQLQTEDELLAQGIAPHEFSPEFEANMDALIGKMRKERVRKKTAGWTRRTGRRLQQVAAVFMVVITLASISVISVDAIRTPIVNFMLEAHEKYSIFLAEGAEEITEEPDMTYYREFLPTVVLDGYIVDEVREYNSSYFVSYQNPITGKNYDVLIDSSAAKPLVDTENAVIDYFDVAGYSGVLVMKEEKTLSLVVWDEVTFFLNGQISPKEALAIMNSLPIY